jgi:hypothetical protein
MGVNDPPTELGAVKTLNIPFPSDMLQMQEKIKFLEQSGPRDTDCPGKQVQPLISSFGVGKIVRQSEALHPRRQLGKERVSV